MASQRHHQHTNVEDVSWWWPIGLATAAGLSTTLGAVVAVIQKPTQAAMAALLGVALGVMATVSIIELLIRNAMQSSDSFLVCAACFAGGLAYYTLEPLFPRDHDDTTDSAKAAHARDAQGTSDSSSGSKERDKDKDRDRDYEADKPSVVSRKGAGNGGAAVVARKVGAEATCRHSQDAADPDMDMLPRDMHGVPVNGTSASCAASPQSASPHDMHGHHASVHAQLLVGVSGDRGPGDKAAMRLSAARMLRLGLLMAVTMTLHNLPEGFAVAFSAFTDIGPLMALAIALHNIPEGIIVAAPIYAATGSRAKALAVATASGLSEPLGAVLSLLLLRPFFTEDRLHYMLAFVGGIMLAVCAIELWPEGRGCRHDRHFAAGMVLGSLVMGWTLYVEGG